MITIGGDIIGEVMVETNVRRRLQSGDPYPKISYLLP